MKKSILKKAMSVLLMSSLVAQNVLAATYQYQHYVGNRPLGNAGTGEGDVDLGSEEGLKAAKLAISPAALQFDITDGRRNLLSSLVSNIGAAPAVLSGIASSADFLIDSNCPSSLPAGASCAITATPSDSAAAGAQYRMPVRAQGVADLTELTLSTYSTPAGQSSPRLTVSQNLVYLGKLAPGESGAGSATVTNQGAAPAILGEMHSNEHFQVTTDCPVMLAAGASCDISVTFTGFQATTHQLTLPLGAGSVGATSLTFYADVISDPAHMPSLAFDVPMLTFGRLAVGASETKTAVLTNSGSAPAELARLASSADFSVAHNCPGLLAEGASCSVAVTFAALKAGAAPAYPLVAQAQNNVRTTLFNQGYVQGTAETGTPLTASPDSILFGTVPVGQQSVKPVVVKNTSTTEATISSIKLEYAPAPFSQANDCGPTLAPGAFCTVSVAFAPNSSETITGRLSVMGNGLLTAVPLSGTGQRAEMQVGPLDVQFGSVMLPSASAVRTISIANRGNLSLTGVSVQSNDNRLTLDYGNCTSTIEPKQGCTLGVRYLPGAAGNFSTTLQVSSTNGGNATVQMAGSAVQLSLDPTSWEFPNTRVGTVAPDKQFTLTNHGSAAAPIEGIGIGQGRDVYTQSNNCGTSLAAGASCSIMVRYTALVEGIVVGELAIASAGTPAIRTTLRGMGFYSKLALSAETLQFPSVNVGKTTAPQVLTMRNTTQETVTFSGMGIAEGSNEFGQTNDCGTSLAPGASCTVNIAMTPVSTSGSAGTWSVVSSFGVQNVRLSGRGTLPQASIDDPAGTTPDGSSTPAPVESTDGFLHYAIVFPSTELGQTSAIRNVKFSNKGTGPLTIQGLSVVAGANDFSQSNNCGQVLAAGQYCTLSVSFKPSSDGKRTGGLALVTDGGKFYFDLSGTSAAGAGVWVANTSADFGAVDKDSSATRLFSFTNTGSAPARDLVATVTGTDVSLVTTTCGTPGSPVTLAVGQVCSASVKYAPSAYGTLTGAKLSLEGILVNSPATLNLSGLSAAPALTFDAEPAADFGDVVSNQTARRTYTLRNTGKTNDTITNLAMVDARFALEGGTCAKDYALAADGTCTVIVAVKPTVTGTVSDKLKVTSQKGAIGELALKATGIPDPSAQNLVLSLSMNGAEGSKTFVDDVGTSVTPLGSPTINGNAGTFNGSQALTLPKSVLAFGPDNYTVEAWIKPTGAGGYQSIISGSWGWQMYWLNGQVYFYISASPSNGAYIGGTPMIASNVPAGAWSHVAVVRNGSNVVLYINGKVASSLVYRDPQVAPLYPASVGAIYTSEGYPSYFFQGQIDDVRVYQKYVKYNGNFTPTPR